MFRAAAALAAALTLLCAPLAVADHNVTAPGAELELSVTDSSGYVYSADLTCMPSGGTHSDPWGACFALKEAKGNPDHLKEQDWRMCTKEYDPVVLTATGHWKSKDIAWSRSFGNECTGHRMTNGIFDF